MKAMSSYFDMLEMWIYDLNLINPCQKVNFDNINVM
jgi:hypothetical protein